MTPSGRCVLQLGNSRTTYSGTDATRVYGVLGHPVQHSLSPPMQQAAFDAQHCDARYVRFDVPPEDLDSFMQDAPRAAATLRGFNVTTPHKRSILGFLHQLDEVSRLTAAVNTVCIDADGRLHGSNTDVPGLQEVWRQHRVQVSGRVLVVVGAGGLARAAVVAGLRQEVSEIRLLNRTLAHAQSLLEEIASGWDGPVPRLRCATPSGDAGASEWLRDAAVLVQATPVGRDVAGTAVIGLERAASDLFVLESLYGVTTPLLRQARQLGLACVDGRALLLEQGVASWRQWMQAEPDRQAMQRALVS